MTRARKCRSCERWRKLAAQHLCWACYQRQYRNRFAIQKARAELDLYWEEQRQAAADLDAYWLDPSWQAAA
jgi:hypothetical protein